MVDICATCRIQPACVFFLPLLVRSVNQGRVRSLHKASFSRQPLPTTDKGKVSIEKRREAVQG